MLYVSSRNRAEAYTAIHALQKETCADGGRFAPVRVPVLTKEQLSALQTKPFWECVCEILNLFYTPQLNPRDLEIAIGKRMVQFCPMSHKIIVAELWRNSSGTFQDPVQTIVNRLLNGEEAPQIPTSWARISVLVAYLFGIYGQLLQNGMLAPEGAFDIAVSAGDFCAPVAVWYSRAMGLPVRTIVCGCEESDALWHLLNHGAVSNPRDIAPDLEQLILWTLGQEEAECFGSACAAQKPYALSEDQCSVLRRGVFPAVISSERMQTVIGSVYRTNAYIMEPASAFAFCGLLDYRTGAGETVPALILMEENPVHSSAVVAAALGMSQMDLRERMNKI